jgi:hypothetical protein
MTGEQHAKSISAQENKPGEPAETKGDLPIIDLSNEENTKKQKTGTRSASNVSVASATATKG